MKDDENSKVTLPSLEDIINDSTSFPRISIEQLKDASNTPLSKEVDSAIFFVVNDKNDVLYAGLTNQLCSLSIYRSLMNDFCNNNAAFMAYWKRNEKGSELDNLLKRVWRKFDPPLNKKTGILMSTFEDIINHLNEKGITKRDISKKLEVHPNTLSNLKENSRNIQVLTLEKLLFSELVDEDIFKELFLKKVASFWYEQKGHTNIELRLEINNNIYNDAASDNSKKKIKLLNKPKKTE
jgi:transcriptional regulator with XRE-family HTH domain